MLIKELYETYKQEVFRYLLHLTHDASVSEDLLSETFLGALQALPRFRGDSELKTWLFAIARNKWYEHLRKERRTVSPDELAQQYLLDTPESSVIRRDLYNTILRLLALEPPRTQSIVQLRIAGYSFSEIGKQHAISENSARVIDFRAKQKIRTLLEKEGLTYE